MKSVSIVMCTYNGAQYLKMQLDSIIQQTYPIFEIIIQDDCSIDETPLILNKYESNYRYIHIYINKKQKGINNNFFSAIERAKGDYIAIADQDDIWELDKIEKQINHIGNNLLCGCFSKQFSDNQAIILNNDERTPNLSILRTIFDGSLFPGHTLLFKKEILNKNFHDNNNLLYDYKIALIATGMGRISFYEKSLVNHRIHYSSATYTSPLNYEKTFLNGIILILKGFRLRKNLQHIISDHYNKIYKLLITITVLNNKDLLTAKKICLLISKQDIYSMIKASILCYKNRDKIFRVSGKQNVLSSVRALFQPILIYHSFDMHRNIPYSTNQ